MNHRDASERHSPQRSSSRTQLWFVRPVVGAACLSIVLLVGVLAVQEFGSATDQRVLLLFLPRLLMVIGLQTFVGNSGIISLGHASFAAIGAYVSALITFTSVEKMILVPDAPGVIRDIHFGFEPAIVLTALITGTIALVVGVAIVRLEGGAAAIATFGFLVIVNAILANWETVTRGNQTLYGIGVKTTVAVGLFWCIVAVLVARLFRESGMGLRLRATAGDVLGARAMGVRVERARLVSWVLSAALVSVGGALYSHYVRAISPNEFFFDLTFILLAMLIIGGRSVSGAVIGCAGVTVINEFFRRSETGVTLGPMEIVTGAGFSVIMLAVLVLLVMIWRPAGLLGNSEIEDIGARAWRRIRHQIRRRRVHA